MPPYHFLILGTVHANLPLAIIQAIVQIAVFQEPQLLLSKKPNLKNIAFEVNPLAISISVLIYFPFSGFPFISHPLMEHTVLGQVTYRAIPN